MSLKLLAMSQCSIGQRDDQSGQGVAVGSGAPPTVPVTEHWPAGNGQPRVSDSRQNPRGGDNRRQMSPTQCACVQVPQPLDSRLWPSLTSTTAGPEVLSLLNMFAMPGSTTAQ